MTEPEPVLTEDLFEQMMGHRKEPQPRRRTITRRNPLDLEQPLHDEEPQ